jgi:hypothetical protein
VCVRAELSLRGSRKLAPGVAHRQPPWGPLVSKCGAQLCYGARWWWLHRSFAAGGPTLSAKPGSLRLRGFDGRRPIRRWDLCSGPIISRSSYAWRYFLDGRQNMLLKIHAQKLALRVAVQFCLRHVG